MSVYTAVLLDDKGVDDNTPVSTSPPCCRRRRCCLKLFLITFVTAFIVKAICCARAKKGFHSAAVHDSPPSPMFRGGLKHFHHHDHHDDPHPHDRPWPHHDDHEHGHKHHSGSHKHGHGHHDDHDHGHKHHSGSHKHGHGHHHSSSSSKSSRSGSADEADTEDYVLVDVVYDTPPAKAIELEKTMVDVDEEFAIADEEFTGESNLEDMPTVDLPGVADDPALYYEIADETGFWPVDMEEDEADGAIVYSAAAYEAEELEEEARGIKEPDHSEEEKFSDLFVPEGEEIAREEEEMVEDTGI